MTTYADFYNALQAMIVVGVARHYDNPPASIDTADFPCAFPMLPTGDRTNFLYSCDALNKLRRCEYVVAVEAAGQGDMSQNTEAVIPLMDNLETALDALSVMVFIEYVITAGTITVAGHEYWAITANITGRNS